MIALSPRFTFLAVLSTLAALSSVHVSDAAVLRSRALDSTRTVIDEGTVLVTRKPLRFLSRDAHKDAQVYDSSPVIPLPKYFGASQKGKTVSGDSPDDEGDGKRHSDGSYGEDAVLSDDKKEDTPHGDHDPVSEKDKKAKDKVRITRSMTGNHLIHLDRIVAFTHTRDSPSCGLMTRSQGVSMMCRADIFIVLK